MCCFGLPRYPQRRPLLSVVQERREQHQQQAVLVAIQPLVQRSKLLLAAAAAVVPVPPQWQVLLEEMAGARGGFLLLLPCKPLLDGKVRLVPLPLLGQRDCHPFMAAHPADSAVLLLPPVPEEAASMAAELAEPAAARHRHRPFVLVAMVVTEEPSLQVPVRLAAQPTVGQASAVMPLAWVVAAAVQLAAVAPGSAVPVVLPLAAAAAAPAALALLAQAVPEDAARQLLPRCSHDAHLSCAHR